MAEVGTSIHNPEDIAKRLLGMKILQNACSEFIFCQIFHKKIPRPHFIAGRGSELFQKHPEI